MRISIVAFAQAARIIGALIIAPRRFLVAFAVAAGAGVAVLWVGLWVAEAYARRLPP